MVRSTSALGTAGLLAAFVSLSPSIARAGNTEHPRTPVQWPDAPCIQTVDRSVDPLFEFTYAIPHEDTQLSIDEFEDSRTHQFVGFCRQWPAGRPPPRYITTYDLERAIAAGFEEVVDVDDPESTLETSEVWADCWTRITADDERRPITFEAAAEPIVWNTSELAAGTWVIAGYTWEPQYNLWSRAPWVLRVVDGNPPDPVQAAASMADTADTLYFDESLDVELCLDVEAGSTVTLEWVGSKMDPFVWAEVASSEIAGAGAQTLNLSFVPPMPSWGETVLLRANVEQLAGPGYTTHALAPVIVFKPPDDPGGDTGDTGETGETETGDTGNDSTAADSGSAHTSCSLDPARGNLPAVFLVLAFAHRRRRTSTLAPKKRRCSTIAR